MDIAGLKEKLDLVKDPGGNGGTSSINWKTSWSLDWRRWCVKEKILKTWRYLGRRGRGN
jgi:hypothetical protein